MRCRRPLIPTSVIAVVAVSLLVAGCGGGSSTTAATTAQNGTLAYARCMRSHGLPGFPDPASNGEIPKDKLPVGSPQFSVASSDCEHLMPAGGLGPQDTAQQARNRLAGTLAFARCMRSHGFPRFPDPTSSAQLTHQMLADAGIDLHQPAVLQDADACVSVTHGVITKAAVARFVAGQ